MRRRSLFIALLMAAVPGCYAPLKARSAGPAEQAPAPAFALPDQRGQTVSLDDMLAIGPAVVIFYRGFW